MMKILGFVVLMIMAVAVATGINLILPRKDKKISSIPKKR